MTVNSNPNSINTNNNNINASPVAGSSNVIDNKTNLTKPYHRTCSLIKRSMQNATLNSQSHENSNCVWKNCITDLKQADTTVRTTFICQNCSKNLTIKGKPLTCTEREAQVHITSSPVKKPPGVPRGTPGGGWAMGGTHIFVNISVK